MHDLAILYQQLLSRKGADPARSWTASLMQGGVTAISKKISEEATELALAARELELVDAADKQDEINHTVAEAADLLYHYLVLLAHLDIHPETVYAALAARNGISGIEEKKLRHKSSSIPSNS